MLNHIATISCCFTEAPTCNPCAHTTVMFSLADHLEVPSRTLCFADSMQTLCLPCGTLNTDLRQKRFAAIQVHGLVQIHIMATSAFTCIALQHRQVAHEAYVRAPVTFVVNSKTFRWNSTKFLGRDSVGSCLMPIINISRVSAERCAPPALSKGGQQEWRHLFDKHYHGPSRSIINKFKMLHFLTIDKTAQMQTVAPTGEACWTKHKYHQSAVGKDEIRCIKNSLDLAIFSSQAVQLLPNKKPCFLCPFMSIHKKKFKFMVSFAQCFWRCLAHGTTERLRFQGGGRHMVLSAKIINLGGQMIDAN